MSVAPRRAPSAGFTLLELLIAMAVTVLVSAAVFGLLTAGQSAFRREPQLSDRQQSIRQAMDMIQDDIMRAGLSLPPLVQAFTDGLDGLGAPGVLVPGQASDHLEILAGIPGCAVGDVCGGASATAGGTLQVAVPHLDCVQLNLGGYFAFFNANFDTAIHPVNSTGSVVPGCAAPATPQLLLGPRMPWTPGAAVTADGFVPVQVTRYEVAPCPDGTPCLWRSPSGQFDAAGAFIGPAPGPAGNLVWQVVARGIDDLQLQYRNGGNINGPWADGPGPVVACAGLDCAGGPLAALNSIVRHVQVTLSSRTAIGRLQGETDVGGTAEARVRGQLTGVFTPRAALATLNLPSPSPPLPLWQ